jgi:hypothetical protein
MRIARFYLMYGIGIIVDAVYVFRWLFEHLHRATVTAYRIAGESWWASEMRANPEHADTRGPE